MSALCLAVRALHTKSSALLLFNVDTDDEIKHEALREAEIFTLLPTHIPLEQYVEQNLE